MLASDIGTPGRPTRGWSVVLLIGWLFMAASVILVGVSSHVIGRPVFWLDDQRWGVVGAALITAILAVPFGAVLVLIYYRGPLVPLASILTTAELMVLAILDRHGSPGAAVVIGGLAVAGLLLSLATFGGRFRHSSA
ncbi:MAG: hypothetical protein ACKOBT_06080 [Actinomycetota bacterium]